MPGSLQFTTDPEPPWVPDGRSHFTGWVTRRAGNATDLVRFAAKDQSEISLSRIAERPQADEIARETTARAQGGSSRWKRSGDAHFIREPATSAGLRISHIDNSRSLINGVGATGQRPPRDPGRPVLRRVVPALLAPGMAFLRAVCAECPRARCERGCRVERGKPADGHNRSSGAAGTLLPAVQRLRMSIFRPALQLRHFISRAI
jgi:hypothetical protein